MLILPVRLAAYVALCALAACAKQHTELQAAAPAVALESHATELTVDESSRGDLTVKHKRR
jgi:hypothetical protein